MSIGLKVANRNADNFFRGGVCFATVNVLERFQNSFVFNTFGGLYF